MDVNIAIVIAAYNRPGALKRLLQSVAAADYTGFDNIPLIISIDFSGSDGCKKVAEAFNWEHGNKTVRLQPQNIGLKEHIIQCADLSQQYEAVIVLEDDLFVSSFFYQYAQQAYSFYKEEDAIAGIALYHNTFNEAALCPFEAIHDGYDNYFMQVPCSWGQLWTGKQWKNFKDYLEKGFNLSESDLLPGNVLLWPANSSWKKIFYKYLVETKRYFVYPAIGLTTNFGDAGKHLTESLSVFQAPLLIGKKQFRFSSLQDSYSIYDAFFELEGIVYNKISQKDIPVSFDLNGTKPLEKINTKYLVSIKKCRNPQRKYAAALYPYENNILLDINDEPGEEYYFSLAETKAFSATNGFERLNIDVKRVFMHEALLGNAMRKEVERSGQYRLGRFLLKPYYFIKRILNY
ncbi:MAG TPA: glycosyltransferase family 2 protein [Chitinophagaceae bacterium]|nr:glycosyltransferase family 2 protein [Chitinophagaceae bacterium]